MSSFLIRFLVQFFNIIFDLNIVKLRLFLFKKKHHQNKFHYICNLKINQILNSHKIVEFRKSIHYSELR